MMIIIHINDFLKKQVKKNFNELVVIIFIIKNIAYLELINEYIIYKQIDTSQKNVFPFNIML